MKSNNLPIANLNIDKKNIDSSLESISNNELGLTEVTDEESGSFSQEEIDKYLRPFESLEESYKAAFTKPMMFCRILFAAVPFILICGLDDLAMFFSYSYIRKENSIDMMTSLGTILILNSIFVTSPGLSFEENFSINLSYAIGTTNITKILESVWLGFMSLLLMTTIYTVPVFLLSGELLGLLGLAEEVINNVSEVLVLLIPYAYLRGINFNLTAIGYAQGIENSYIFLSISKFLANLVGLYYFMGVLELQLEGFAYAISFGTLVEFFGACLILYLYGDKSFIGMANIKQVIARIFRYFLESVTFLCTFYCEEGGYHLVTILVTQLHDKPALAAFLAFDNTYFVLLSIPLGLSLAFRTRLNIALGQGRVKLAKGLLILIIFWGFIAAIFIGLVLFLSRNYMSERYSLNLEVQEKYSLLVIVFSICFCFGIANFPLSSTVRSLGSVYVLLLAIVFGVVFVNGIMGYFMGFVLELGVASLVVSYNIGLFVSSVLLLLICSAKNWNNINQEDLLH